MSKRIAVSTYLSGEEETALYDDLVKIAAERRFEGVMSRLVRAALFEFRDRHRPRDRKRTGPERSHGQEPR